MRVQARNEQNVAQSNAMTAGLESGRTKILNWCERVSTKLEKVNLKDVSITDVYTALLVMSVEALVSCPSTPKEVIVSLIGHPASRVPNLDGLTVYANKPMRTGGYSTLEFKGKALDPQVKGEGGFRFDDKPFRYEISRVTERVVARFSKFDTGLVTIKARGNRIGIESSVSAHYKADREIRTLDDMRKAVDGLLSNARAGIPLQRRMLALGLLGAQLDLLNEVSQSGLPVEELIRRRGQILTGGVSTYVVRLGDLSYFLGKTEMGVTQVGNTFILDTGVEVEGCTVLKDLEGRTPFLGDGDVKIIVQEEQNLGVFGMNFKYNSIIPIPQG